MSSIKRLVNQPIHKWMEKRGEAIDAYLKISKEEKKSHLFE